MGVVVRRYIDILTIIINFPYSLVLALFLAAASLLCSFLKCFFGLYIYMHGNTGHNSIYYNIYVREFHSACDVYTV